MPIVPAERDSGAEGAAVAALTPAFIRDPIMRWLYPEAESEPACFPGFIRAFGGEAHWYVPMIGVDSAHQDKARASIRTDENQ